MIILFPKKNGVKIATTLIFQAMQDGESFQYIIGMIDFAAKFGAVTPEDKEGLLHYLKKRG